MGLMQSTDNVHPCIGLPARLPWFKIAHSDQVKSKSDGAREPYVEHSLVAVMKEKCNICAHSIVLGRWIVNCGGLTSLGRTPTLLGKHNGPKLYVYQLLGSPG